jgi:GTP:adenosylcobinamide-phosphate guanylyltransferase
MAGGNAVRWNGISKQKICINGEMLIKKKVLNISRENKGIVVGYRG